MILNPSLKNKLIDRKFSIKHSHKEHLIRFF
jgi:hypothetical protein